MNVSGIHRGVDVLGVFVAPTLIVALDRFAGYFVDQLVAQAVACLLVDLAERHSLGR